MPDFGARNQVGTVVFRVFSLRWWNLVFAGFFEEKRVQDVVFLWGSCGELRGKRGQLTVVFRAAKNETHFGTIFSAPWTSAYLAEPLVVIKENSRAFG